MLLFNGRFRNELCNRSQWKEKLNSFRPGRLPCTRTALQLSANGSRSRPTHPPIRKMDTNAPPAGQITARDTYCGSTFPAFDVQGPSSSVIIEARSKPGRGLGSRRHEGARVGEGVCGLETGHEPGALETFRHHTPHTHNSS